MSLLFLPREATRQRVIPTGLGAGLVLSGAKCIQICSIDWLERLRPWLPLRPFFTAHGVGRYTVRIPHA